MALSEVLRERQRVEELQLAGLLPTRSLLFTGPPGVGKTLAARWLAARLGWPLLTLDLSAVMSSFLGRTGTNVRHVLDYAKGIQCVLLLDELDALAKRRDDVGEVGELKRLVTVLLQEIDDWPPRGLLVAATNHPLLLDPAVWRRFDTVVEFPLPDDAAVEGQLALLLGQDTQPQILHLLKVVFRGRSHSTIAREVARARRSALINGLRLDETLVSIARERTSELSRPERREVGVALMELGLSQREVHALTGLSRDTLRKSQGPTGRRATRPGSGV